MMLDGGKGSRVRIFSPLTIRAMTSPQSPPGQISIRGFGWDIDSHLLEPSRRSLPGGFVWSHRFHRNVDVDGPVDAQLSSFC